MTWNRRRLLKTALAGSGLMRRHWQALAKERPDDAGLKALAAN